MIFEELSSRRCDVLGVSCQVLLSLRLHVSTRLAEATVWHAMGVGCGCATCAGQAGALTVETGCIAYGDRERRRTLYDLVMRGCAVVRFLNPFYEV